MNKTFFYLISINIVLFMGLLLGGSFDFKNSSFEDWEEDEFFLSKSLWNRIDINRDRIALNNEINEGYLNDSISLDPIKIKKIQDIFTNIRIKRPIKIPDISKCSLQKQIKIFNDKTLLDSFHIYRCAEKDIWQRNKKNYIVEIYGYNENLFETLSPSKEWKDLRVLKTQWMTLKKLSIYDVSKKENILTVLFKNNFYQIEGLDEMDTTKLYYYIHRIKNFRSTTIKPNKLLKRKINAEADIVIEIEDVLQKENTYLHIFKDSLFYWGVKNENKNEIFQLFPKSVNLLLKNKNYFKQKKI